MARGSSRRKQPLHTLRSRTRIMPNYGRLSSFSFRIRRSVSKESIHPKFVALSVVPLLQFAVISSRARDNSNLSARVRQIKNTVSAIVLIYSAAIWMGFALRYNDFDAMSFDPRRVRLVHKSKVFGNWFPFYRIGGDQPPHY